MKHPSSQINNSNFINNIKKTACFYNPENDKNKIINNNIINNKLILNNKQVLSKEEKFKNDDNKPINMNFQKLNINEKTISTSRETKPKTRNIKPNIPSQSSDELLKIAINKEKKHLKNSPNKIENFNFFKREILLPEFAKNFPISIFRVYQSKNENIQKECTICLEDFIIGREIITLPCFHIFHVECICDWLRRNKTCPLCKINVSEKLNK